MTHGIKIEKCGNSHQILASTQPTLAFTVQVKAATPSGGGGGGGGDTPTYGMRASGDKTIIKAGTPLTGDLTARNTAFTPATTTAVGVLLDDVDVTGGTAEGSLLVLGGVDLKKMDADVAALYTSTLLASMKGIFAIK